ncbi:beta-galactosidase [Alteribacter aurantiacus]|uniref:beta-galactosidase n=1 Tax=Alteribacter aurantiacus TaxID=254410 RepID=UPI0003FCD64B
MNKFPPISERVPHMLHGADYNPEQWLNYPDILEKDMELMKEAECNVMSVGIFSWVSLEPEEGVFTFEWMDQVLDRLHENGISVFLATPSGARPAWMSQKYPEVLRVEANRVRNLHGFRHNHCYTSPVYREKVRTINEKLAERYAHHPAVIGWHISNEYGGECHCELCQHAFRNWVKEKYHTLDRVNHAWWTTFWSHTYTSWDQIESPAPHGEMMVHGQNLDWKRFVTDRTVDFCRHEIEPLKEKDPTIPVTTNFMGIYEGLDYWKFAEHLDVISWDAYPTWHDNQDESFHASGVAFTHDLNRSLKGGQPFMLMESTPSMTNWQNVSKLKKPGMHHLSSLQAVAHGSDTVQYFQWRKSRGSSEKLHGAVVDHYGESDNRVFQDVKGVGLTLEKLSSVTGTSVQPEVAIIFDWENRWAINDAQGPRNIGVHYERTVQEHYLPFWERGIPVDVVSMDADLSKYKVVVAPMLYMVREGVGEKIDQFVQAGGTFVTTYWSGIVNETDLCFLGGFPGPLRKTLGIRLEEIDGLHDGQTNGIDMRENSLGMSGRFKAKELCDLIHLEGATSLAEYTDDFYKGRPALAVNEHGEGKAYYIASRNDGRFHDQFVESVVTEAGVKRIVDTKLPKGVTAQLRTDGETDYVFLMNFTGEKQRVQLDGEGLELFVGESEEGEIKPYGVEIFTRKAKHGHFSEFR